MDIIHKDLPNNIELKDPNNPLSAVGDNGKQVYKYAYHPKTGRLLYSYPGDHHLVSIEAAGDGDRFNEYVRIIYDYKNNVAGSRIWGEADIYHKFLDINAKSFEVQYATYQFFKQFDPGLKWILNITNNNVTPDEREELVIAYVPQERILDDAQMEGLRKNFNMIYEDARLNGYWGLGMVEK